jgi:hypothetical protein
MLGADEDDSDAGAIKDAILLIEKAWGLTGGQAEHAIALIAGQFKLINQKIKTDETIFKIVLDRKLLINYPSSAETLAVLRTLLETIVRLDLQDDREKIVSLMDFLSGFWNIDERVLW